MLKNVILILDDCKAFARGLQRFAETKELAEVHIVEDIADIEIYSYDYLLVDDAYYDQLNYPDRRVYRLTTDPLFSSKHGVVNRLSKASQILECLGKIEDLDCRDCAQIVLFSMSGGTGKSTIASGICDALEMQGRRALNISFSTYLQNGNRDLDLSLIVYYLYKHKEIPDHIEKSIKMQLSAEKYILNCALTSPEDISYLTPEVLIAFTGWLSNLCTNRLLIIEAPWSYNLELQVLLQFASHRVLVADTRHSDEDVVIWLEKYKKMIHTEKGFYMLMNKSEKQVMNQDILGIPKYDVQNCRKGLREWTSKYLLTHWIR